MSQERLSSIHKVSGGTPEQQEEVREKFEKQFSKNLWYVGLEREKTLEENELIALIIEKLNEFLFIYGATPLMIRESHIHILDKLKMAPDMVEYVEEFSKNNNTTAFLKTDEQQLFVLGWEIKSPLQFAGSVVHELIHLVSFNSMVAGEEYEDGFIEHRTGLFVKSSKDKTRYFEDLNEAITEELSLRFELILKDIPSLTEEYNKVLKARQEKNDPYISYVYETGFGYSYEEIRKKFNNLVKIIYEKRKDDFNSEEEVFNVFARAAMTGEVKGLATIVESTLGIGTFKKIAQSINDYVEA